MAKAITDPRTVLARAMSEAQLQQAAIEAAKMHGYLVTHFRPGQSSSGKWTTPIQGDAGFFDLALARPGKPGRLLCVELKSQKGRINEAQQRWFDALTYAPPVETYLWTPSQWLDGTILKILRGGEETP